MHGGKWIVYIIQTETGRLYTGITTNLQRRLAEHQSGKGASFFQFSRPEAVVYFEEALNRSEASKRECAIKKMSRKQKLQLINIQGLRAQRKPE